MSGWRAALRIARRSVRRHLGRSLLIIALIAVPVAAVTVADGIVRTITDRDVDADRAMGSADIRIEVGERDSFELDDVLPAGARAVPLSYPTEPGSLRLADGDRIVRSQLNTVVLGDPLTAHLARLSAGRLPENPGETLVTEPLAERLGLLDAGGDLRPGATIRPDNRTAVTVTGLAVEPYCLTCADVVAPRDTVLGVAELTRRSPIPGAYLVDLPAGTDVARLARTWPMGKSHVITRDSFQDTTPIGGYFAGAFELRQPFMLFAGLGLIGIVITAGAAFAVAARAQVRELGLVAVSGGEAKHVRRIVLAQGLVLGVLGAVAGLLLGVAVTVLGLPLWETVTGQLLEGLRFGWGELVVAGAIGVVAGVFAALVPAVAVARMHPVDALAGRFHVTSSARPRVVGVVLVFVGVVAIVMSGLVSRHQVAAGRSLSLPAFGLLAGVAVAMAGLIVVMPALVAGVGRLGDRLPLSGRLALRDAVRHRHRTVAAATAVMVTVAASVVTAFVFSSQAAGAPRTLPADTVLAQLDMVGRSAEAADGPRQLEHVVTNVKRAVPGAVVRPISLVAAFPQSAVYLESAGCYRGSSPLGIAGPEVIELVTGRKPDAGVRAALAEGKIVSFDSCLAPGDEVSVFASKDPVQVPVYRGGVAAGAEKYVAELPTAFVSASAAAARGWGSYTETVAVTCPPSDLDVVRGAVEDVGMDLHTGSSDRGFVDGLYFLLAGLAAGVAFLGAGVTVALSSTDGRADLATLAALGAAPRRRRMLGGAQALVVTGLGAGCGLVLGVCAGFAAAPVSGYLVFSVPWAHLLVTLAVPLLAAAVAVVATPSRLTS